MRWRPGFLCGCIPLLNGVLEGGCVSGVPSRQGLRSSGHRQHGSTLPVECVVLQLCSACPLGSQLSAKWLQPEEVPWSAVVSRPGRGFWDPDTRATCLSLQIQPVVPLTIQPHRLSLFQVILKFLTLEGALYSFSRSRFILFVVILSLFLSVGSWVRRLADLCSICYLSGNQEHF